jgi:alpha-N-acetylglucosaminidase
MVSRGIVVLLVVAVFTFGTEATPSSSSEQLAAVEALLVRYLPAHASLFSVSILNATNSSTDVFELEGGGGQPVQLRGTSGVALASALNWYLKYYCNSSIFWGVNGTGMQLALPSPLPAISGVVKVQSPVTYRYYMNVCTVSYSAVWWNWERWQYEIDLMAMNGINLPLGFTGQEYVWAKVWRQLGLNESEFEFSGPAFLAWYRMGNIRNWGAPLDKEWLEGQRVLQKQSLLAMRAYGMRPVLPCFAGHVPQAIQRLFPTANITTSSPWAAFNATYGTTYLLQPTDPLFAKIGSMFTAAVVEEYGTDHIYNCDTFNEMDPSSNQSQYLAASSAAVVGAMRHADPQAVWLMQGWLFLSGFWTNPAIEAYLGGVANDQMIILDLYSEAYPIWSQTNSYFGKPFIWCMLHNFGGNRAIYGNISGIASSPLEALATKGSTMVGTGLTPEAIEQNPVMYELMMEMGWRSTSFSTADWVQQYASRKYGTALASGRQSAAGAAWELLRRTAYASENYWGQVRVPLEYTPSFGFYNTNNPVPPVNATAMTEVVLLMLQAATSAPAGTELSGPFLYDLTDFSRQMLVNIFIDLYQLLGTQTQQNHSYASITAIGGAMLEVISDIDTLLASNQNFLLGTWLAGAESWASKSPDVDLYRFNAINQLTLWGPTGQIDDYAAKQWAGLVGTYYYPRWAQFISALQTAAQQNQQWNQTTFDAEIMIWEQQYNANPGTHAVEPTGDTVALSKQMVQKYTSSWTGYSARANSDIAGSTLISAIAEDPGTLAFLCTADPTCLGFNSQGQLKSNVSSVVSKPGVTLYVKQMPPVVGL